MVRRVYVEVGVTSHLDVEQVLQRLRDKHGAELQKAVLLLWLDVETLPALAYDIEYVEEI